ncbi:hypothetical protein KCV87_07945 [Actinosynnema pretiosum subsp. pretiosum]|uniref:Transmembrane protein n=1 Tax=Actinosynnema pretiosum subsp. pretiosum TaxID=103721 RepID=A0AA45R5S2_9PSEU|nr:hypothetical protein APASM_2441 [Actinosynnema pretiosum subsp. pretiosum]QUF05985.1 hypothetical protein KCV87_07945 [Actinosynnema pretiosum subsp. pretiosum]
MDEGSEREVHEDTAAGGRNSLARPGDLLERVVIAIAVLLVLLALPVAAAIGSEVHSMRADFIATDVAEKHPVTATLTEDAPVVAGITGFENVEARAEWTTPAGATRTGLVGAPNGSPAGAEVEIWVDGLGGLVPPPPQSDGALIAGVTVALGLWAAFAGAIVLSCMVLRALLNRLRATDLEREWARVEPVWTSRA